MLIKLASLGKCKETSIVERMLWVISNIDKDMAKKVAEGLGMKIPKSIDKPINQAIGADADVPKHQPGKKKDYLDESPALSMANTKFETIATRQIAILAADGFNHAKTKKMMDALKKEGAMVKIVAPHGGNIKCDKGEDHKVDAAIATTESVLFDAIYIADGKESVDTLISHAKYLKFVNETFKYCKAISVDGEGERLLDNSFVADFKKDDAAVHINEPAKKFMDSIAKHRNWKRRELTDMIPV